MLCPCKGLQLCFESSLSALFWLYMVFWKILLMYTNFGSHLFLVPVPFFSPLLVFFPFVYLFSRPKRWWFCCFGLTRALDLLSLHINVIQTIIPYNDIQEPYGWYFPAQDKEQASIFRLPDFFIALDNREGATQLPCHKYPRGIISKEPTTTDSTFDQLNIFFIRLVLTVPSEELGTWAVGV